VIGWAPGARRLIVAVGFFAVCTIALAFIVLPVLALLTYRPPSALVNELSNPLVTDALVVSVETSVAAQVMILLFGTPLAYLLASRRFRGRSVLVTLVELPIVLPPAVAGIGLIVAFGRAGLLGGTLSALGIDVSFDKAAVILAVMFVAGPLYVRTAIAAFQTVDPRLVAASRTLGAGPTRTFFHVVLPLAGTGLAAGAALALARGLGEFGATIMFAGSLQGVTQTLPLAIYYAFDINLNAALTISALFVIMIASVLMSLKLTSWWHSSRSVSRSRSAIFASS
jgi:molybdate transport system permease protein